MITRAETLEAVLDAARHALTSMTGESDVGVSIGCVAAHRSAPELMAALPWASGPLELITLGCEGALLDRIVPPGDAEECAGSSTSRDERLQGAFHALCSLFRQRLTATSGWARAGGASVAVLGPGARPVTITGASTFVLTLSSAGEALEMAVAFAPSRDAAEGGEIAVADGGAPDGLVTGRDVAMLLDHLVMLELDVQVSLPQTAYGPHPGCVVGCMPHAGARRLAIATGFLDDAGERVAPGQEVIVFFHHDGRLLQFSSIADGIDRHAFAGSELPVLLVAPPDRITRGQRRRAARVVPRQVVTASVRPLGARADEPPSGAALATVADVSLLGVGLEGPLALRLLRFAEGQPVLCALDLPDPWGRVEVPGTVRRVARLMRRDGSFRDVVGVEFFPRPSDARQAAALDAVREMVVAECRAREAPARPVSGADP